MIRIRDIKLPIGHDAAAIMDEIANMICLDKIYPGNSYPDMSYRILRRSIDARHKPDIFYVYTVGLLTGEDDEQRIRSYLKAHASSGRIKKRLERILFDEPVFYEPPECGKCDITESPVVIGAGPAGLFCALLLARRGFRPKLYEQGKRVEERSADVAGFWRGEKLSSYSNVQFGEGGAGTFSDGKLNTLTKDASGRNSFVLRTFYEHGAKEEITYDAKPHIGTDVLKSVVANIREEIISLGGQVFFDSKLTGLLVEDGKLRGVTITDVNTQVSTDVAAGQCVLAIGHSARDTFEMLYGLKVPMEQKNFAVGFRMIHPQALVDKWQYGEGHEKLGLPAADYKVTNETEKGRRVYSFCMCPGGYVVNASSEDNRVCVNGMSESGRDGKYANSAIIAAITPDDFIQSEVSSDHPLAGMYYQRMIEEKASERGKGNIPVQFFEDFEAGAASGDIACADGAIKGIVCAADLRGIFSEDIDEAIIESVHKFGYTREEFDKKDALMAGIESRTSSPVRIPRNDDLESSISGLYPCGEGAGYAGGIVSAAVDGMKCAESIIRKYRLIQKAEE